MKKIQKFFQLLLITSVIFQCCAGFTVFKLIRIQHIHKYVHSAKCEKNNALFLGCFNDCNGNQQNAEEQQKKDKTPLDQHFHVVFLAVLNNVIEIIPTQTSDVPLAIYRDVNWNTCALESIFQPPKTA